MYNDTATGIPLAIMDCSDFDWPGRRAAFEQWQPFAKNLTSNGGHL